MREMRFESLAVMRFSSGLVGACGSVYLAWQGFGPISLAIGNTMATVTNSLIAVYFRPAHFPWWPGTREIKRVLSFGGKFSAAGLMETLSAGSPELLLGKLQSLTLAGYYSRASGLTSMFQKMVLDATHSVMLPLFAKEHRQHGNINASLLQAMAYVTALGWSFFLGLGLMAFPVVRLLYGTQWDESVDLVRLLSAAMAIALPAALCPLALSATGAVNRLVSLTALTVGINVVCLTLGAWQDLNSMGWALIVGQSLCATIWLVYTRRKLHFSARALARVWLRSAAVALVTALAPLTACLMYGMQPSTLAAPLAITLIGGSLLFLCATYSTRHPIFQELQRLWR
jgi:O-antigen/teichoic acid export membrane protein